MLNRFFRLSDHGTTVARELQAGVTTFAALAYILAVNPGILSATGMDKAALITVTGLTAALSTILMGLLTNYPIALAPGMGINAFFAFTICLGAGVPWSEALGMVFVNGLAFVALSVSGVRERILHALPYSLKIAITCGIGGFIAFIGLQKAGIVVSHPQTLTTYGDFAQGPVALALGGLALTAVLVARRVPGAIVLSMVALTALGLFIPDGKGGTVTAWPTDWLAWPASPAPVFFKLTFGFLTDFTAFQKALPLILTLLIVDLFDNIGTLIGVTKRAGLLDAEGRVPKAGRALLADSLATVMSALFGTSTVVSYIESASGVEAGGRTALTTFTTAALLLLALFFTPLLLVVPAAATAPALIIVGVFMLQSVNEIKMNDFTVAVPAVLTLLAIPLTFSIAEGIGFGLLATVLLGLATRRTQDLTPFTYGLAGLFLLEFFHLFPFNR